MNISKLFYKRISSENYLIPDTSLLYLLSLAIFLVTALARESFLAAFVKLDKDIVFKAIIFVCITLLAMKEYKTRRYKFILFIYLAIIVVLAVLIKRVAYFTTAITLLYLYSARDVDFRLIAKVALAITTFMLFTIIALSHFGVIQNYIFQPDTDRPREFLGFRYALFAPALLFNVMALALYIWKKDMSLFLVVVGAVINQWLYKKTDSRMSYIFTLLIILTAVIIKIHLPVSFFPEQKREYINGIVRPIFKFGVIFSFVLCAGISIFISINYNEDNRFQKKLNSIMTQRLNYGKSSYEEYGVTFLGQNVPWVGNGLNVYGEASEEDRLYVDNVYLQFLQHYGILFFSLVMCLLTYAMYCLVKEKQWMLIYILLIVALHGIMDDLVLHIWYNTFWLAMTPYVFKDKIDAERILRVEVG